MPVLYFDCEGLESRPARRATLTFGELRGMFGGYETRFLSPQWPRLRAGAGTPARVLVQVSERDGAIPGYDEPGFYLLVDLPPAKVDELLKYRDSYARRLDDAELWEARHAQVSGRRFDK